MAKLNVLTYENLRLYDGLIKSFIAEEDAKSLKTVALVEGKLNFYTVEEPIGDTVPAFSIELPKTDLTSINAAIAAINNETTGILATAKKYTDAEIDALSAEGGAIKANADAIAKLNGNVETEGSVAKAVKDASDAINKTIGTVAEGKTVVDMIADAKKESTYDDSTVKANIGDLTTLKTSEKGSLVGAVNEVKGAVDANATAAKVTVSTETTTEGYLKSYTIKQGETQLAVIDIPKDLVVTAGEVVVDPEGQEAGTYVKLTIANQETPIYINVKDLVDAYTAQANAKQIQLVISETNEISATIVAGSVGTTELADGAVTTAKIVDANVTTAKLADNAVTTAKIADKNVTLVKLADDVQTTLTQVGTNKTDIASLKELVGEGVDEISSEQIYALFATGEATE